MTSGHPTSQGKTYVVLLGQTTLYSKSMFIYNKVEHRGMLKTRKPDKKIAERLWIETNRQNLCMYAQNKQTTRYVFVFLLGER